MHLLIFYQNLLWGLLNTTVVEEETEDLLLDLLPPPSGALRYPGTPDTSLFLLLLLPCWPWLGSSP